jgi:hypothetical protein
MAKYYIMYDGRAMYKDTDDCSILEAIGTKFTQKDWEFWKDHDAVLVEYEMDKNVLDNEVIIGHVESGYSVLKQRIEST